MRLLRNLPIAAKLALSSVAALGLLGGLVFVVLAVMDAQRAAGDRAQLALEAERAGRRALSTVREMQLADRDLQFAQSDASVTSGLDQAGQLGDRTARLLTEMAGPEGSANEPVVRATELLAKYRDALTKKGALRADLLRAREAFLPLKPALDTTIQKLREDALVSGSTAELVKFNPALSAYQALTSRVRDAVVLFLASGDRAQREELRVALSQATGSAAALNAVAVEPDTRERLRGVVRQGTRLGIVAQTVFEQAEAFAAFADGPAASAARSLGSSLDAAVAPLVETAEAERDAAAETFDATRRTTLLFAAGIAVVMGLSLLLTSRAVGRPIRRLTDAVQRMARGDAEMAVGFAGRRDEVGRMAAALEVLRAAVRDAYLRGQIIEQLPVGVLTASATPQARFPVVYANAEARRLTEQAGEAAPVPAGGVVGAPMGALAGGMPELEAAMADPALLPQRRRFALGEEVLDVEISALLGPGGGYAGPMMTWKRVTQQVALSARFEREVAAIARTVEGEAARMADSATELGAAAERGNALLDNVAKAAGSASGNVDSVAVGAEELAASVAEIGRQVAASARMAADAVGHAAATDRSVSDLDGAAARIGSVVRLIHEIAERTNLLALNATIEAARAGDAGRGFAVVANEVKTLASQTAKATEEIASQIAAMQTETRHAVEALRRIGASIQDIDRVAATIATAVEEQGAATQEIARAVADAASGTRDVSGALADVAAVVRRAGDQAATVAASARDVTSRSEVLTREAGTFLEALRAA